MESLDSNQIVTAVEQYCGPPGLSLSEVLRATLRGASGLPAWPQLPAGHTIPTQRGRNAIAIGCELLGLGAGAEVLMPAYNCGTEIEAVRSTGAAVCLYRIDRLGRVDCEDLMSRLSPRTRAVSVTHYFGWPQDLDEIVGWCRQNGLLLIEDCALSLFSVEGAKPLGQRGDAAIFSFPKTLAVPDGGALVLQSATPASRRPAGQSNLAQVARRCAGLLRRRVKRRLPIARNAAVDDHAPSLDSHDEARIAREDMPADYYWDDRSNEAISRMTLSILSGVDPHAVAVKRRTNYSSLFERLRELPGVVPWFGEVPPGVCPLECPLIVGDKASWVRALRARGVEALPWWSGYHRQLPWGEFPDACYLKDHLLTLPVNQDLDADAMEYVAGCVEEIARRC